MTDPLSGFQLTPDQRQAATELQRDVLLTAGAGTGKTRTLVARYVYLLSQGLSEREIVAITFTDKAAREMRNRIRRAVSDLAQQAEGEQQARWLEIESRMDAARIGTIHSLCAEVLRAHPAEARIDPTFVVVDEGLGLTLKSQAVADALAWAAGDDGAAQLFRAFTPGRLSATVSAMLAQRLETEQALAAGEQDGLDETILAAIESFLRLSPVADGIAELRGLESRGVLEQDAGPALGPYAAKLLELWSELEADLAAGELLQAFAALFQIRRQALQKVGGRAKSRARAVVYQIQDLYDEHLGAWIGGAKAADAPPSADSDAAWQQQLPRLEAVYRQALAGYRRSLQMRRALDFDDLESGALALLETDSIGERWRARLDAVLVDEFQDTNQRQRRIIDALVGGRLGCLFGVGDARQSIYRFRGADVQVFRRKRQEVQAAGGLVPEIDRSFRAHAPLLAGLDDLIGPLVDGGGRGELYRVPYTPLTADRAEPRAGQTPPYLELVLGAGKGAEAGRAAAAAALAGRLLELREAGAIREWGEVALLFRASTGFEPYETALEAAAIPFVTVAGRGFYQRPEIRDLINTLRAIADPSDDQALAGFLRSPAIGISDPGLHRLRADGSELRRLRAALEDAEALLEVDDWKPAARARRVLAELHPLVDRLPVAELISQLVGRLDWRAVLASSGSGRSGSRSHARLWRNLDKLIDDAQASELVNVSAFLEYLQVLRAAGAREGEAPAGEGGALQLMTIHKSKGLEFELVVLADAARAIQQRAQPVYLMPEIGLAARMDRLEGEPTAYRLSRALDAEQSNAEEDRLLYVAATRARERLIVSGHLSRARSGWGVRGWLKRILELLELKPADLTESAGTAQQIKLPGRQKLRAVTAPPDAGPRRWRPSGAPASWPDSDLQPLHIPAPRDTEEDIRPEDDRGPVRTWRATSEGIRAPARPVGLIVHAAIRRGAMPGSPGYARFIENECFGNGLVDPRQRRAALDETTKLLARLAAHPLWEEIGAAEIAQREVPFTFRNEHGKVKSGRIDLLWCSAEGWKIVDFKTDRLRDEAAMAAAIERYEYRQQVLGYIEAVAVLLGERPAGFLCFLDLQGQVALHQI